MPVNLLASCFNRTTATYKFYWLLSILEAVESGERVIPKKLLFSRMIAHAWYTINYFHLSFGKLDNFQKAIEQVKSIEDITVDAERRQIFEQLSNTSRRETEIILQHFDKQVPHWFLSPWFPGVNKQKDIYDGSMIDSRMCLYKLYRNHIELHPTWIPYLTENVSFLRSFCYWHLAIYLQVRNPNVPDIPNKLFRSPERASLYKQRKEFWDIVLSEKGSIECIYTNKELVLGNYHVEHFVPFSFVSHDLIWNLIPADPSFNSRKSDKLPPIERYFDAYFDLQCEGVEIVRRKSPKNKLLEDYLTIIPELFESEDITNVFTRDRLRQVIQPLISIAANNGFEYMS